MKQRGRPKGRSRDNRSFGPLGDLIRSNRLGKGLGLLDVAKACGCSVQFVSNIEHGRAPLPWEKVGQLASVLKIPVEDLQAANLAIRSDFKSFVGAGSRTGRVARTAGAIVIGSRSQRSSKAGRVSLGRVAADRSIAKMTGTASAVAFAAKDAQLREIIEAYQTASMESRKKFVRAALQMLG
jgi:transcriptional regulator with XRE-family HTH domain